MLYEIRRYVCTPGKRAAVLLRFDEVVLPLFDRHGVDFCASGRRARRTFSSASAVWA